MTMPWLAELNGGWDAARAAFLAKGPAVAAGEIAAYLGLDLTEPLDARVAGHTLAGLLLTRGRILPGKRSATFSWPHESEAGTACWLFPLFDAASELIEVLAFDGEGDAEGGLYTYGEAIAHVGFDADWRSPGAAEQLVLFERPRAWLRHWITRLRQRDQTPLSLHRSSPADTGALIVRPGAVSFMPVRRERAAWAVGVGEVVVVGQELGDRVKAAFAAAATNPLPELKVAAKGGRT